MKSKAKKIIIAIILILILVILAIFTVQFIYIKSADTSWIEELGYEQENVYNMKVDRIGIPYIPVLIEEKTYYLVFDTGCGSNISVTNLLDGKIDYTLLGTKEQLNRDGSHRGWSNYIKIDSIKILGRDFNDVECTMTDWEMSSTEKYYGIIGTNYFQDNVVTLDYRAHKVAIGDFIDYSSLDNGKYFIVPMLHTKVEGQESLVFIECKLNGENIVAYIDTGKNLSYIHDSNSTYEIGSIEKPETSKEDVLLEVGDMSIKLKNLYEANMPQIYEFDYPVAMELNSDQFIKNDIVVTFDFINDKVVFYKR